MSQLATLKEVAQRARVSLSTASLVLNDRPGTRIAAETRRRVWQAARDLGYRSPRVRRTARLQFLVGGTSQFSDPHDRLIAFAAAQEEAERRGAQVQLGFAPDAVDDQIVAVDALADAGIDGTLVAAQLHRDAVERIIERHIPAVLLGATLAEPRLSSVHADNQQGAKLLMEHLLELGHRRIAFCGMEPDAFYEEHRHQVYLGALLRAGVAPRAEWSYWSRRQGESLEEWLSTLRALPPAERPTAVLADQKQTGRRLMAALQQVGWRVPKDVSVAMFDDLTLEDPEAFPVTCVRRPIEAIARQAVIQLLEELANPGIPQMRLVLPVEPLYRASTAPPAAHAEARGSAASLHSSAPWITPAEAGALPIAVSR